MLRQLGQLGKLNVASSKLSILVIQFFIVLKGLNRCSLDPFDCERDPCHLAWLIRDNRDLLGRLSGNTTCSNGTTFEQLNPNEFDECIPLNPAPNKIAAIFPQNNQYFILLFMIFQLLHNRFNY